MSKLKTALSLLRIPRKMIAPLASRGLFNWIPDKPFLKLIYYGEMGKKLKLKAPQTYNEKLQWLKLHDHNPLYPTLVDKYEVKKYVADKIGEEYIIPTLGVWDNAEQIAFEELPDQFVLKCTHDSGSVLLCRDKLSFSKEEAVKSLDAHLHGSTYWFDREWPYKNLKPRIIAEEYMEDSTYHELRDYKFFCFDGVPKAMFIASERLNPDKPTAFDFFDMDFNHLPIRQGHPNAESIPEKPLNFEKMKELAAILSEDFPHVRVDFYEINGKVYFGELTFYHFGGVEPFIPDHWDKDFGEWLSLPQTE